MFLIFILPNLCSAQELDTDGLIYDAMRGQHRSQEHRQRDSFRHPYQTLNFFGLRADMTVVEIWPGRGWYTEILAPVLRNEGKLYLAGFSRTANKAPAWRKALQKDFEQKLSDLPKVYDRATLTALSVPEDTEIAPAGSADMVLTFRNVHNWMKGGYAEAVFDIFYNTLKPGGILGIVEHRAVPGTSLEMMIESGYVTEAQVIDYAEQAGFEFVARTDINANTNDSTDHPAGVWTLPPTLRHCKTLESEHDKNTCIDTYLEVGESDRMTLRFRKP